MSDDHHNLAKFYGTKDPPYFEGARDDFVSLLPDDDPTARVLEIGCSAGATGSLALESGKCREYFGVELTPEVAKIAGSKLTKVCVGDVEKMELDFAPQSLQACIMSEVLEHLVDPWSVLRKVHEVLEPGGIVLASSPNVSHWQVIAQLLRGRFDLTDIGPMDRTHLRWFTPATFGEMFVDCGYEVDRVWPIVPLKARQKITAELIGGREHLFVRQMCVMARRP